ncbi:hypothetical protein AAVH_23982 [Aphelenchoides avenae]|nr:hypothetical protein AAVH_23982 [Aphelenchus avenae]
MSWPMSDWNGATAPTDETLRGKYVRLEKLDVDKHCEDIWQALCGPGCDPNQFRYVNHGPYATAEEYKEFVRQRQRAGRQHSYAVVNNATGKAEGVNCYGGIHPEEGTIEVGENLGACMQRTPRSTEARFLLIDYAFSLGFRRVECRTVAENVRAQQAFVRAGYEYEGTSKKKHIVKGRAVDTIFYVIFIEDWHGYFKTAYEEWLSDDNQEDGRQKVALAVLIEKRRAEAISRN